MTYNKQAWHDLVTWNHKLLALSQVVIFPKDFQIKFSIMDPCGYWVSFFPRLQKMSFHIFGSSVLLLQPSKVHIICPYATIHNCWKKKKKKVEFRVCILRINNCRKKSSCSTVVWLMSKGTETNLALSSRLFLVS